MSIKAIGFDLDDTLYSRAELYKKVFKIVNNTIINIDISFSDFFKVFQKHSDIEYNQFINRIKTKNEYRIDRVINTYQEFNISISVDEAIIFNSLYLYFRGDLIYRNMAEEVLEYLKNKGYELFILTNGPYSGQKDKLKVLKIDKYIPADKWFISDEIGYTKPDKRVFQFVEKELNYQGHEILYIGDDYINDIKGSQQLNWNSIFLNLHDKHMSSKPENGVQNFSEIKDILKDIFLNKK